MKKTFLVLSTLMLVASVNAQTLEEIVNKSYAATGSAKLENANTIYMEGKASQMGTELTMIMITKKPDKVKMVMSFNGMDITTVYDGEKGWMVNPMTGSFEAVEIPADQIEDIKKKNLFRDELQEQFKLGNLQLAGEEDVNGRPAFKLMIPAGPDAEDPTYLFIDKESYLVVKTSSVVRQAGQVMNVDAVITEYADVNGVKFPKVTATYVNGIDAGSLVFDKIEIDKPVEDSEFKVN